MSAGGVASLEVVPFSITVDAAVLDDLRDRIRKTRLPEAAPGAPWAQGTDRDWLAELLEYWAGEFDWRAAEHELNRYAQYRARVGDAEVHFVHERARGGNGIPIVLGHGWPSCFAELLPLVPLLTDPARHGIDGPGFDVVIPSLPGYCFSSRPAVAGGVTYRCVARLWRTLMRGLGYPRYAAGGGDFGAGIATFMALDEPAALTGLHLTNLELSPYTGDGLRAAVRPGTSLPGAGRAVGRNRARVHGHPVDEAANAQLRAQRLARRAGCVDPGEVAGVERLPWGAGIALLPRLPAHRRHAVLGDRDDRLVGARLLRQPPLARRAAADFG